MLYDKDFAIDSCNIELYKMYIHKHRAQVKKLGVMHPIFSPIFDIKMQQYCNFRISKQLM